MDIGEKLRTAREDSALTQEQVAERLNVSRQTVSNWENGRSYPDIRCVLALGELYGLSLDELMREDRRLVEHLEEQTDTVRSHDRLRRAVSFMWYPAAYLAAFALTVLMELVDNVSSGRSAAAIFFAPLMVFSWYALFPCVTLGVAFHAGKHGENQLKWLGVPAFGLIHVLMYALLHPIYRTVEGTFSSPFEPSWTQFFVGAVCAFLGMLAGELASPRGSENREIRRLKRAVPAVLALKLATVAAAWFETRPYAGSVEAWSLAQRFQGELEVITEGARVEAGRDEMELNGETVTFIHYRLEGYRVRDLYRVTKPEQWERVRRPREPGNPAAKVNLGELCNLTIYDSGYAAAHDGYATPRYKGTAYYRITDAAPEEAVRFIEGNGVSALLHETTSQ